MGVVALYCVSSGLSLYTVFVGFSCGRMVRGAVALLSVLSEKT